MITNMRFMYSMSCTRLVIGGVICILVLWIAVQWHQSDHFVVATNDDIQYVNVSDKPWEHHPIESVEIDIKTKFDTAYYYELDNAEYDVAITKTFQYPCRKAPEILRADNWRDVESLDDVRVAYDNLIAYIKKTVNSSDYLQLPSDNPAKRPVIQIVHDVLIQAKRHVVTQNKFLIYLEAILYRESKYHGKHMRFTAIAEYDATLKNWSFYVIEADVVGIVYEDKIGIFPVVANYDLHVDGRPYANLEKDESILPDDRVSNEIVQSQNRLQAQNAATNQALSLT